MNYKEPSVLRILLLTLLFFSFVPNIQAQTVMGLSADDLPALSSDDVSDAQLRMFKERAEQEGISINDALQMAVARGLRQSVASQLRSRIQSLGTINDGRSTTEEAGIVSPSELERVFIRPDREEDEEMRRTFGSEIFRVQATEFIPSQNIPTPNSYTLGPGDELSIQIWGDQTNSYRPVVTPAGTLLIDNLGPVQVSGLTIAEANERIKENLQQIYSGLSPQNGEEQTTYASITLSELRTIQVAVIGEAVNPGDYALPSYSTVYHALYRAGGPAKNGTYRRVRVLRNNELVAELDLYNFLVEGVQKGNIQLRDGDVIQIPPYRHRVEVFGETKRNDLYFEVTEGESLSDLVRFAGYFTDKAYTHQFRIHRNTPTERKIMTVSSEEMDDFLVQSGDVLYVDEILDRFVNRVSITGAVWRSGEFELTEGMTLHDLITVADGIRPDAFLTRGLINRLQDDYSFEQISFNVGDVLSNPESSDMMLKREDHIVIRSIHDMTEEQTVAIEGAVQDAGEYYYRDGMILEDLILKADGFLDSASEGRIEISRRILGEPTPNQRSNQLAEIFTFRVNRDLRVHSDDLSFELEPFDRVVVHQRPDFREQRTVMIEGEVLYPGTYTIENRNERVSDIIARAGGITKQAYLPGARLVRQISAIDRPGIDLDFLSVEDEVATEELGFGEFEGDEDTDAKEMNTKNQNEEPSVAERRAEINRADSIQRETGSEEDLTEQERLENERRIGIDLESVLANPGSDDDLFIRPGDVIRIPEQLQTVAVSGAVMQSVEIKYQPGRRLNYYINRAGGFTENARAGRGYVVYANGDVDRRKRYLFGLFKSSPKIEPGAQIIIPEKADRERLSTGEIISISSAIVGMSTSILIAIDRIQR